MVWSQVQLRHAARFKASLVDWRTLDGHFAEAHRQYIEIDEDLALVEESCGCGLTEEHAEAARGSANASLSRLQRALLEDARTLKELAKRVRFLVAEVEGNGSVGEASLPPVCPPLAMYPLFMLLKQASPYPEAFLHNEAAYKAEHGILSWAQLYMNIRLWALAVASESNSLTSIIEQEQAPTRAVLERMALSDAVDRDFVSTNLELIDLLERMNKISRL